MSDRCQHHWAIIRKEKNNLHLDNSVEMLSQILVTLWVKLLVYAHMQGGKNKIKL